MPGRHTLGSLVVLLLVVTGDDALERYRGNTFIAMDVTYFRENIPTG